MPRFLSGLAVGAGGHFLLILLMVLMYSSGDTREEQAMSTFWVFVEILLTPALLLAGLVLLFFRGARVAVGGLAAGCAVGLLLIAAVTYEIEWQVRA